MDRTLTAAGLLLAIASAVFPWYIFLNPEKFRMIVSSQKNMTRELPDWPARPVVTVSPAAIPSRSPGPKEILPFDQITTASTLSTSSIGRIENDAAMLDQPLPSKSPYRLLHVANGRALVEDSSGLYMVQVGSVLPDESRLAAIEQRDGKWVIVTSKGVVSQN